MATALGILYRGGARLVIGEWLMYVQYTPVPALRRDTTYLRSRRPETGSRELIV